MWNKTFVLSRIIVQVLPLRHHVAVGSLLRPSPSTNTTVDPEMGPENPPLQLMQLRFWAFPFLVIMIVPPHALFVGPLTEIVSKVEKHASSTSSLRSKYFDSTCTTLLIETSMLPSEVEPVPVTILTQYDAPIRKN